MPESQRISEDAIIEIAEKLYGKDTEDFRVFCDAALVRKNRRKVCKRFEVLSNGEESNETVYYKLSEEFRMSVSMIKKVIQRKEVYLK